MATRLIAQDVIEYQLGFAAGRAGLPAGSDRTWWYREGWIEAQAGRAALPLAPGLPYAGPALAKLSFDDVDQYSQGENAGARSRLYPNDTPIRLDDKTYWFREGVADGVQGLHRFLQVDRAPWFDYPGGSAPNPPPPPTPPVDPGDAAYGGPLYLELAASILGRTIPYDVAVQIDSLEGPSPIFRVPAYLLSWHLFGDAPGDPRRGFRLSGPRGPIARYVRRLIAAGRIGPYPSVYGLPAWVGTRTQGSIRLIGRVELARLGLLASLEGLYESSAYRY